VKCTPPPRPPAPHVSGVSHLLGFPQFPKRVCHCPVGIASSGPCWTYLRRQAYSIVRPDVGPGLSGRCPALSCEVLQSPAMSCDVLRCPAACHPFDKIKTSAYVYRTSSRSKVASLFIDLAMSCCHILRSTSC